MTATPTADQGASLREMVAPGQEPLLDEFLAEMGIGDQTSPAKRGDQDDQQDEQDEQEQAERLLAGKFKSVEDLERGYDELQRLMGKRQEQEQQQAPPPTREQQIGTYGEAIVAAAEKDGIDLNQWDAAVKAGADTTEWREKLAATTGIPQGLIERYEAAFRPAPAAESQGLSEGDAAEIKGLVGGDAAFSKLAQWATANLSADELADYNEAVNTSKAAARFAVRALAERASRTEAAPTSDNREPELIGGGRAARADVFETQDQMLAAMRKTGSDGKRLYNTDPRYKAWFEKTLARSDIMGA